MKPANIPSSPAPQCAPPDFRPLAAELAAGIGHVTAGWWGATTSFTWLPALPKGGTAQFRFSWTTDEPSSGDTTWQNLVSGANQQSYDMTVGSFSGGTVRAAIKLASGRIYLCPANSISGPV